AEARTRGGRSASRWLREERGGPVKQDGGNTAGHSSSQASNNNAEPTTAEVAPGPKQFQQNLHIPTQPAIITQQQQLSPINSTQAHQSNPATNTHNIPALQNITEPEINDAAALTLSKTVPPAFQPDNLSKLFSTINSPITSHQFNPIILNRPQTENNNGPQTVKQFTRKVTRASTTRNLTRPDPTPKPDPTSHRPSPGKKPKIIPNPTQHPSEPKFTQTVEDTDTQSEKKRRREEENVDDSTNLK
ncbi:hypothetical protein A2U01_0030135, partial [Trifolium medium]|nr:hypothetical protein [Trifolium medium]